jgi:hypothetical protein
MNAPAMLFRIGAPVALLALLSFTGCSGDTNPSAVPQTAAGCKISAGSFIQVYEDPFHTQRQCQFNVNASGDAYVVASPVVASDKYVVYVQSPSRQCVYMTPIAKAGLGCNLAKTKGITAPGGRLTLTWQLSTSLKAGSYSVNLYDQTLSRTLGTVHVSLLDN